MPPHFGQPSPTCAARRRSLPGGPTRERIADLLPVLVRCVAWRPLTVRSQGCGLGAPYDSPADCCDPIRARHRVLC